MTPSPETPDGLVELLRGERDVVRAWWDEDERRLAVALMDAGTNADDDRAAVRRIGVLTLPLRGGAGASLACGPEYGVTPTARGRIVFEREPETP